jgi:hypothetical protein
LRGSGAADTAFNENTEGIILSSHGLGRPRLHSRAKQNAPALVRVSGTFVEAALPRSLLED